MPHACNAHTRTPARARLPSYRVVCGMQVAAAAYAAAAAAAAADT